MDRAKTAARRDVKHLSFGYDASYARGLMAPSFIRYQVSNILTEVIRF